MSAQLLQDSKIEGLRRIGPVHLWTEGRGSLALDEIEYLGHRGAVMFYTNPPVHQIGNLVKADSCTIQRCKIKRSHRRYPHLLSD